MCRVALRVLRLFPFWCLLGLAGCAGLGSTQPGDRTYASPLHWQGRIGIRTTAPKAESMSANFEVDGNAAAGTLRLSSPLGTTYALMQWSPGLATLATQGEPKHFGSMESLVRATLGIELPLQNFFDWLHGIPNASPPWQVDLSAYSEGKITATRNAPDSQAQITLLLDAP